jgi:hypothetical protein
MLKYLQQQQQQQQQQQHHRSTSSSLSTGTSDTRRSSGVPWLVVLTKCDLMSPTMVARSILATEQDLVANGLGPGVGYDDIVHGEDGDENEDDEDDTTRSSPTQTNSSYHDRHLVVPVSAATGAGVQRLWLRLLHHARLSTIDHTDTDTLSNSHDNDNDDLPRQTNPFAVREHHNAALLRKQDYLRQLSKYRKIERVGEVFRQVDRR